MRDFEAQGLFHLPTEPSKIVVGYLVYSTTDGITVRLTGTFSDHLESLPSAVQYPVVLGVIATSPYGRHVTLLDCFPRQTTLAFGGLSTEELRANRAYVGSEFLPSEESSRFETVSLRYSHLQEWSGLTGMHVVFTEPRDRGAVSLEYRPPNALELQAGEHAARLETGFSTSQSGSTWQIAEEVWLTVHGLLSLTPRDVFRGVVSPLQDFFTFAADRPSPVEEIAFRTAELDSGTRSRRELHLLLQLLYTPPKEQTRLSLDDMLFGWGDIASLHPNILSDWLKFRTVHRAACDIFFGLQYSAPTYLETRYLLLLNALGLLLAKRAIGDPSVPDVLGIWELRAENERDRRWLSIVPERDELTVPWTTYALLQTHADVMTPLVGDPEEFVTELVAVRRKLFHLHDSDHEHSNVRASQVRLLKIVEKLSLLLKVGILDLLGFSVNEVKRLISRNRRYAMLQAGFPK